MLSHRVEYCCGSVIFVARQLSVTAVVGDHDTFVIPSLAAVATPWWGRMVITPGLLVDEPQGEEVCSSIRGGQTEKSFSSIPF